MLKKYCILDSEKKYIESKDTITEEEKIQGNFIFEIPPNINDKIVAFWENDSWKTRRKKLTDNIDQKLYNELSTLQYDNILKGVISKYTFSTQKKGRKLTHKEIKNFLEIELNKYKKAVIELSYNKEKIPKIYKNYITELEETIDKIKKASKNKNNTLTKFRYESNDIEIDLNQFLDNKLEADLALEEQYKLT